jgi:hypothetical protein
LVLIGREFGERGDEGVFLVHAAAGEDIFVGHEVVARRAAAHEDAGLVVVDAVEDQRGGVARDGWFALDQAGFGLDEIMLAEGIALGCGFLGCCFRSGELRGIVVGVEGVLRAHGGAAMARVGGVVNGAWQRMGACMGGVLAG